MSDRAEREKRETEFFHMERFLCRDGSLAMQVSRMNAWADSDRLRDPVVVAAALQYSVILVNRLASVVDVMSGAGAADAIGVRDGDA